MHVDQARDLAAEVDRPIERRIAAAEDHQPLAVETRRLADPVMQLPAFECVRALEGELLRLE